MKKFKFIIPSLLIPTIALPIVSCSNPNKDQVTLTGYTDASIVGSTGVNAKDYWLTAEPATTTCINVKHLNNVGNIQTLYGENGFNQAVLLCKKDIYEKNPKYLNQVKTYLQGNQAYVSDANNLKTIITNINNHLTKDMSGTLSLNNTTTDTLVRCNTKYVEYEKDKESYKTFLNKAKTIDNSITIPSDDFFKGFPSDTTTTETTSSYKFICPDGAPAVGLSNLLTHSDTLSAMNSTSFEFIKPDSLMTRANEGDFVVCPCQVAAKLQNNYYWLSTITWGNLYILSNNSSTTITKENMSKQLLGKTMGVLQINSIPGIVLKLILQDNNIKYA